MKLFDSMSLDNSNRASLGRLLYLRTLENGIGFKTSTDEIAESFNHLMDLLPKGKKFESHCKSKTYFGGISLPGINELLIRVRTSFVISFYKTSGKWC